MHFDALANLKRIFSFSIFFPYHSVHFVSVICLLMWLFLWIYLLVAGFLWGKVEKILFYWGGNWVVQRDLKWRIKGKDEFIRPWLDELFEFQQMYLDIFYMPTFYHMLLVCSFFFVGLRFINNYDISNSVSPI